MRHRTFILILSALAATACAPPSSSDSSYDESAIVQEVTEVMNGLTEAMNAHDAEAVFRFYRQDDAFFYLGCTDILFGWGSFATRVKPYYDFNTDVIFEREILSIQLLSANTAVVALQGRSTEAAALFWTEVLQRSEGGEWLITHEHESWPDCSEPRGPHMGTEGMGEMGLTPGDSGVQGLP